MAISTVHGPFKIPFETRGNRKIILDPRNAFWEENPDFAMLRGCYVFAIKTSRAYIPYYVGLTKKTFKSEVFHSHKIVHYNSSLTDYARGYPVFFFVVHPSENSKGGSNEIEDIETFLINIGLTVNPALTNVRNTKQPTWAIKNGNYTHLHARGRGSIL